MSPVSALLTSASACLGVLGLALVTSCVTPTPPASGSSSQGSSDPSAPAQTDPEPVERPEPEPASSGDPIADAFVEAHNRHRAEVSPAADPPLPPVRWSDELAATARAWAKRCVFEHRQSDYGENLGAGTDRIDPAAMVAGWASESAHFDHRRNRCASGKVCGHYTQVVWRNSTAIGCAIERCNGGGPFGGGEWYLWVCNYSPSGNWKDQRPY
jgi:pathogenesis-related protein 1